jgi:hypothetical protein
MLNLELRAGKAVVMALFAVVAAYSATRSRRAHVRDMAALSGHRPTIGTPMPGRNPVSAFEGAAAS